MQRYKVVAKIVEDRPLRTPLQITDAQDLQELYGLYHLAVEHVAYLWGVHSESLGVRWAQDTPALIERVFQVELKEISPKPYCGAV